MEHYYEIRCTDGERSMLYPKKSVTYIAGIDPYKEEGLGSPTIMKVTDGIMEMIKYFDEEVTKDNFDSVKNLFGSPKDYDTVHFMSELGSIVKGKDRFNN